eukprot:Tamp_05533.p1 GENE.Tamp_05533~~Tamp_05533.p1  ORF type:complete len:913 (-),score=204.14 Tamp_05533:161-2899(-)
MVAQSSGASSPLHADFKNNPKKTIKKLIEAKQLAEDPEIIARFLLHTPGLDDAALGDYVGDGDEMCSKVLTCYVSTFNFKGLGFDDALRKFLSAFRLPGEAQRIERIMDAFSAQFYANNPSSFRHADTAFKLAYSVIMLNTDAHNPAIKASRKMTKEQFVRNNRGLDDGHDLPQEFLETIHDRIVANEIKMQPFKNDAGDKSIMAYTNPHKQGWLKKESGRLKAWNERWFLLKDACLYYLRKPPVWGADCELCGHIPLHTSLIARSTRDSDQPSFLLEMSGGSMLKMGKVEKRGNVMKTTQVGQLRLLASSHGEAQEWVAAINSNVKALNDARNGLPAPEWTRGTSAYSHGLQAPHHNHAGQPSASHAGALPHVSSLPTPGASASQLPAPRTASLSQAQVSSPAEMRPDNDSAPLASPDMSRPAAASSEQPPTPIAHATADAPAAPAAVVVATTPAATRHAPAPPLPPPHSVPVPASADAAGATDRHGRASRECAADSGSDAFGNAMCGPSDGGPPLSEGPYRAPSPPKPPPSGGPADSAASSASPTHTTADAHARSHLPNHDSSAVLSPATEGSALEEGAVPHSDLSTGARGPGAVRDWELRMDDKMLDKLDVGNGVEDAVEDVKETFTITLNQGLECSLTIPASITLDSYLKDRIASFYSAHRTWPLETKQPQLSALHMAMAGFSFEPDADYQDRVVCEICGLSVGSWEENDDPMQAHVQFVSEAPNQCIFVRQYAQAYQALLKGDVEMAMVPLPARSKSLLSPAPLGKGRDMSGAHAELDEEAFEEALVRLERASQRLVVEQQYGQRLEALTSSLVGKIQSWVLRLRKEEATRDELQQRLILLRQRKKDAADGLASGAAAHGVQAAGTTVAMPRRGGEGGGGAGGGDGRGTENGVAVGHGAGSMGDMLL